MRSWFRPFSDASERDWNSTWSEVTSFAIYTLNICTPFSLTLYFNLASFFYF